MDLHALLGNEAESLLSHTCTGIPRSMLHAPGPDFIDRVLMESNRSPRVLGSLQALFNHGRLAGTGYLSILPVDQGVEHSAGASFSVNPIYFKPESILELALEGGCNAVASTLGVLGSVARKYAHKLPFILKLNHNELLSYPNRHDQTLFASVDQAFAMGAQGVGATVYFGSDECRRQIREIGDAFAYAHQLGMVTILWAYLRNDAFKHEGTDYHTAADLSGQANYLAATLEADIVKQKLATVNGGYRARSYRKTHDRIYSGLSSQDPIDLVRYRVANCYMGRSGLITSGGDSSGQDDLTQAVRTSVINKRAGGMGLICGRKAFQRPMAEGIDLLHAIQDVYLDTRIDLA